MDVVTILQNVSFPIAAIIVTFLLGRTVLAIIRLLAGARAERMNAETRGIELKSQADVEVARLDAEARTKIAEASLEQAKMQSVTQKGTIEREAKLATELETYRAQADVMRLAQARALQETSRALIKLSIGQNTTEATVKGAESRLGTKVEEARDATVQSLERFKDLFIMTIDLMMEDPSATFERIKRMQNAWAEGDMEKAQAVVDEDVPTQADTITHAVVDNGDSEGGEELKEAS